MKTYFDLIRRNKNIIPCLSLIISLMMVSALDATANSGRKKTSSTPKKTTTKKAPAKKPAQVKKPAPTPTPTPKAEPIQESTMVTPPPPPLVREEKSTPTPIQEIRVADVVEIDLLKPKTDHTKIGWVDVGQNTLNENGSHHTSLIIGMRNTEFPNIYNTEGNVRFLNYGYGANIGENVGIYADFEYLDLEKTLPLHATNFLRHVQFATGYALHGNVNVREGLPTQWAAGVGYTGQMFFSKVFSAGPVLTIEGNDRTGFSAKASTQVRYATDAIIGRGEIGGISPFSKKEADAFYSIQIDARVLQIGDTTFYLGGKISNNEYKAGEGWWSLDPNLDHNRTQVKAQISVVR